MSNNVKNSRINELFEKIRNNKKTQYIILFCLVVVALLAFVFGYNKSQEKSTTVSDEYVINYVENLEDRLTSVLSKVNGVGKVSVIITVESGMETVLAMKTVKTETINGIEIEETPILINGKTVTLMEKYPKITGVLIVLESTNFAVIKRIQDATKSLLDINYSQIEILTMK